MISKCNAVFEGHQKTKDVLQGLEAFVHRAVQKVARGHLLLRRALGGRGQRHENTAGLNRFPGLRIHSYQLNNQDV